MFVVVWASLVINTLTERGPIIFLKLAESLTGQFDGIIYPSGLDDGPDIDYENTRGLFVNYTKVMEITDNKYNLAPRKTFCGSRLGTDYSNIRTSYDEYYMQEYEREFLRTSDGQTTLPKPENIYGSNKDYPYQTCVVLMDTEREREIHLGAKYKYPAMTEGQCLINKYMADQMNVVEGDVVYNKFDIYQNLVSLIDEFNRIAFDIGVSRISREAVEEGNDNQQL